MSDETTGGMFHRKVQVWVLSRAMAGVRVLMLKTNSKRGAFWQPVTGSVEAHETPEDAALREAMEETGLEFSKKPMNLHYEFEFAGRQGPVREFCYCIEAPKNCPPPRLSAEHQDFSWVKGWEARQMAKYGTEALEKLMRRLGVQ